MLKVLRIVEDSLQPDYAAGDFVLIAKIPFCFALHAGDVVVFRHPDYGTMIKRVERVDSERGEVFVVGSHPRSVDSRVFGMVSMRNVAGKVLWHIRKPRRHGV